jgi:hypothetical protein
MLQDENARKSLKHGALLLISAIISGVLFFLWPKPEYVIV